MEPRDRAAPYHSEGLHGRLVHQLGREIVTGRLPAGGSLPTEEQLVRSFGSSRSAVREATKVLVAKGLVLSRRKVGTIVQPESAWNLLDPDVLAWRYEDEPSSLHLDHLAQMRVVIEPEAARMAARARKRSAARAIRESYHRMEETVHDSDEFILHDLAFHRAVIEAGGNQLLVHLHAVLEVALAAARQVHTRNVRRNRRSLPAHKAVLEAILARDGDAAADLMRQVVTNAHHDIRRERRAATK
ncbi:FadR/GntR family transcriptional regulator [Ornithinicoccus halotolerans]|uniref:FadR/GntR family transcriptional regulator n=1 Tax=Ornithinicoccus halotolerans TaxID=1748220 RepID=UPI001295EF8C|nr:FadR/GntR family transcriptional regulator [Ornithinicoccus halotolerans]